MTMQTDVKSVTGTVDGELVAVRSRVKAMTITCTTTAGSVVLKDGGVSGASKLTINTPGVAEIFNILIPGEGVLFENTIYLDVTNVSSVTVFHG